MAWFAYEKEITLRLHRLKIELAEALEWPCLENLSWFQTWPGGWCLHGRASRITPQDSQRSINFALAELETSPTAAILQALEKVRAHPARVSQRVRWYCAEHGWEEILPRGQMSRGCSTCGLFSCEVIVEEPVSTSDSTEEENP